MAVRVADENRLRMGFADIPKPPTSLPPVGTLPARLNKQLEEMYGQLAAITEERDTLRSQLSEVTAERDSFRVQYEELAVAYNGGMARIKQLESDVSALAGRTK